jgi:hypothetical protein
VDGFYAAYLTGHAGNSAVLLAISKETLIGVDMGGMKYDGHIERKEGGFSCRVSYVVPTGIALITGPGPVASPTPVTISFDLPANFAEGPIIGIQTPFGPLNAKFTKLRDLDF